MEQEGGREGGRQAGIMLVCCFQSVQDDKACVEHLSSTWIHLSLLHRIQNGRRKGGRLVVSDTSVAHEYTGLPCEKCSTLAEGKIPGP